MFLRPVANKGMSPLLREGDASTPKWIWLAFLGLLCLALLGLVNRRNMVTYQVMAPWAAVAALLLAIVGVWVMSRNRDPAIKLNHYGPLKRCAALVSLFIFNGMIGYFAVLLGFPTIWSRVALSPRAAEATVTHILSERTGKGCHWRIEVDGGPLPEAMSPCVSSTLWASLRTGNSVSVIYTQSSFAFVIEDIQAR